jgi:hypothetical protein
MSKALRPKGVSGLSMQRLLNSPIRSRGVINVRIRKQYIGTTWRYLALVYSGFSRIFIGHLEQCGFGLALTA